MDEARQEHLLGLKQKVVNSLVPLVLDGDGSPEETVETALVMIDLGNAPAELYTKVFDTINKIESSEARASYLMRLLAAIQLELSQDTSVDEEQAVEEYTQPEQDQQHSEHAEEPQYESQHEQEYPG